MTAHASANRLNVITMAIKSKIVLVSVKTIFVRMKHRKCDCSKVKCKNGGILQPDCTCNCDGTKFTGDFCNEESICNNKKCMNNGDLLDNCTCLCSSDYEGENCQIVRRNSDSVEGDGSVLTA